MFKGCNKFNQPVEIPESVLKCAEMFSDCHEFNQPVTIPSNVYSCRGMFSNCHNLDSEITVKNEDTFTAEMFAGCENPRYKSKEDEIIEKFENFHGLIEGRIFDMEEVAKAYLKRDGEIPHSNYTGYTLDEFKAMLNFPDVPQNASDDSGESTKEAENSDCSDDSVEDCKESENSNDSEISTK
jgi:hypothetical protein